MPKWTNKGHEFDELGNYLIKHNEILIYAKDDNEFESLKSRLEFLNLKIRRSPKQPVYVKVHGIKKYLNKIKYHFEKKDFQSLGQKGIIIVSNASMGEYNTLLEKGFEKNKNLFSELDFFTKYLSIYALYLKNKVYFPSNCFICTTVCTLNCKDCLNFAPYDKHKEHFDIQRLKEDIDIYFKCVDRVGEFGISGGEPFTYPYLIELIEYIGKKYRDKIEDLTVYTNMTILPSDELCKIFKKYNVLVELDDYTVTLPRLKEMQDKIITKLKSFNVDIKINIASTFFEFFPPKNIIKEETSLTKKFDACNQIFCELKNKKLYTCNWAEFANQAGVTKEIDDYYDLTTYIYI